ncbi:AAA family ATPase [Crocinitomicaceae bacterium]|jgi:exodeoxyribonuclease V|nr:AAA family ATPase [Crocinitomicaceae bacterium]
MTEMTNTMKPTGEQRIVLSDIASFFGDHAQDYKIVLGAAGTGKSTILKWVLDLLNKDEKPFYLCAPTGAASKVIRKKTQHESRTVHSLIYDTERLKNGLGVKWVLRTMESKEPSVFIVDESSMISDLVHPSERYFSEKPVLTDLIAYIKSGNKNNKIIFIGDRFQLPPSSSENESPALSVNYLQRKHNLTGSLITLTEVLRQGEGSYVLDAATALRHSMENSLEAPELKLTDLNNATSAILKYVDLYDISNPGKATVVAWTNKDVNFFNGAIRDRLGLSGNLISSGDQMVMQGAWSNGMDYIMKGDIVFINEVSDHTEQFADLSFRDVSLTYVDSNFETKVVKAKALVEVLTSVKGELSLKAEDKLLQEAYKKNPRLRESKNIFDDKYAGAFRLRYGHALTCHKAQGSEWENVILHPYMPMNDLRWKYTAITRAVKEVYTYPSYYQARA